jgi:hypothetical protein
MIGAQDIEATAVGQACRREARPVGLGLSFVALAGHRPFTIRCRSTPQRHETRDDAHIDLIAPWNDKRRPV